MRNQNKVLVIGLDGATFDLIQPWVKKGVASQYSQPNGKWSLRRASVESQGRWVKVKFMKWEVVTEGGDSD